MKEYPRPGQVPDNHPLLPIDKDVEAWLRESEELAQAVANGASGPTLEDLLREARKLILRLHTLLYARFWKDDGE